MSNSLTTQEGTENILDFARANKEMAIIKGKEGADTLAELTSLLTFKFNFHQIIQIYRI